MSDRPLPGSCLVPVRCLSRSSRSMHFGDVSEMNVTRNASAARNIIMSPRDQVNPGQDFSIRHLRIYHNTSYSPKSLHNLCFPFLPGITDVPREIAYVNFWGARRVNGQGDIQEENITHLLILCQTMIKATVMSLHEWCVTVIRIIFRCFLFHFQGNGPGPEVFYGPKTICKASKKTSTKKLTPEVASAVKLGNIY